MIAVRTRKQKVITMFKSLNELAPVYLQDLLNKRSTDYELHNSFRKSTLPRPRINCLKPSSSGALYSFHSGALYSFLLLPQRVSLKRTSEAALISRRLHYRGLKSLFLTKRKELWLSANGRLRMRRDNCNELSLFANGNILGCAVIWREQLWLCTNG